MTRLSRDIHRRKFERLLAQSLDEPMITLIAGIVGIQNGYEAPLKAICDVPREAVGAPIGSKYHIPLWSLETLVNELLATPKVTRSRQLRADTFETLRVLSNTLLNLENAEDGIFLKSHDVFTEMGRLVQRQFPWQRGSANAPNVYRSLLLYGSGTAGQYFEETAGISVADFVKVGTYLARALGRCDMIGRHRDLSAIGITPEKREAALRRLAIAHGEARSRAGKMRAGRRATAYRPSILRNHPILAFGDAGERLRAPIPELITYRYTSGLYLDVVGGGGGIWGEVGKRFEAYVHEYLHAMMAPYKVCREFDYGPRSASHRTPDVLISDDRQVVCAIECKAKRMSFDARFADDPLGTAATGFNEMAKSVFQLWKFFAHARLRRIDPINVATNCLAVVVTADGWLTMAPNQAEQVLAAANRLADEYGGITPEDRRDVAFCPIEDVESALQHGTPDGFLAACREVASGEKKGWMLSVAKSTRKDAPRPYPFRDRIQELLPWFAPTSPAPT